MYNALLIGCGYWGKNLAKTISENNNINLIAISDIDRNKLVDIKDRYKIEHTNTNYKDLINSLGIDIVFVATPVNSHYGIVKYCLSKHLSVFCEKILSTSLTEVEELYQLAHKNKRLLFVDYTFLHNSNVKYIKQLLNEGKLGRLFYLSFKRCGYGPIRGDVGAVDDLAAHDISIMLYWLGIPKTVTVTVSSPASINFPDIAFIQFEYSNNTIASIELSWLTPIKERKIEIVGDNGMITFDDMSVYNKLKIIKKSVQVKELEEGQIHVRSGDITIPNIPYPLPLSVSVNSFITMLNSNEYLGESIFTKQLTIILNAIRQNKKYHRLEFD